MEKIKDMERLEYCAKIAKDYQLEELKLSSEGEIFIRRQSDKMHQREDDTKRQELSIQQQLSNNMRINR